MKRHALLLLGAVLLLSAGAWSGADSIYRYMQTRQAWTAYASTHAAMKKLDDEGARAGLITDPDILAASPSVLEQMRAIDDRIPSASFYEAMALVDESKEVERKGDAQEAFNKKQATILTVEIARLKAIQKAQKQPRPTVLVAVLSLFGGLALIAWLVRMAAANAGLAPNRLSEGK